MNYQQILSKLAMIMAGVVSAHGQTLTGWHFIDDPTQANSNRFITRDLTPDGRILVGEMNLTSSYAQGAIWRPDGGLTYLSPPFQLPHVSAIRICDDEETLIGEFRNTSNGPLAFYRGRIGDPLQPLFNIGPYVNSGHVASKDGSLVAANAYLGNEGDSSTLFYWTQETGVRFLEGQSWFCPGCLLVRDTTRDGMFLVGNIDCAAVWWGRDGRAYAFPDTDGGFGVCGSATAVSQTGRFVLGVRYVSGGDRVLLWTRQTSGAFVAEDLGRPTEFPVPSPRFVSEDGRVIAGAGSMSPVRPTNPGSFIWTRSAGMMEASEFFRSRGVVIPDGWQMYDISAMSENGRIFAGLGKMLVSPYRQKGVVIYLPDPCIADFNEDGGVDGADVEAFFVPWQAGDPIADVNQDGGVDGGDVEAFFGAWEAGGC